MDAMTREPPFGPEPECKPSASAEDAQPPFALPLTERQKLVVESYQRHKSVRKVGAELKMAVQTVYKYMQRLGYALRPPPEFTREQMDQIIQYYESTPPDQFNLTGLSISLGKSRQNISRFARRSGITRRGRSPNAATHAKMKGRQTWKDKPHPRGMAGKKHTPKTLATIGSASRKRWATDKAFGIGLMSEANRDKISERMRLLAAARPASACYSRAKRGRRQDLGETFFRSSWEANYARYLNLLVKLGVVENWKYEPETFWFEGIRRGTASYKPDFCVKYKGDNRLEYIEIKGWVTAKDRVKWQRMEKYHPQIKLTIIKEKGYRAIERKWSSCLPEWERYTRSRNGRLTSREVTA